MLFWNICKSYSKTMKLLDFFFIFIVNTSLNSTYWFAKFYSLFFSSLQGFFRSFADKISLKLCKCWKYIYLKICKWVLFIRFYKKLFFENMKIYAKCYELIYNCYKYLVLLNFSLTCHKPKIIIVFILSYIA